MKHVYSFTACCGLLLLLLASPHSAFAQYSETFDTPNKGILFGDCTGSVGTTCASNDFAGVNWTIEGDLSGIDDEDRFVTNNAGMLEAVDVDEEACWVSPLLTISGGTTTFEVDLTWFDFENTDYISVEYEVNESGTWMQVSNVVGGGTNTIDYTNSGVNNNSPGSATDVGVSNVSASTLRIRVCVDVNSVEEVVTIDNVSATNATAGSACDLAITSATPTAEVCPDDDDGTITVAATCGVCTTNGTSIQYSISPDPNTVSPQASNVFMNLPDGTYTVTVIDSGNAACTATETNVVVAPGVDTEDPTFVDGSEIVLLDQDFETPNMPVVQNGPYQDLNLTTPVNSLYGPGWIQNFTVETILINGASNIYTDPTGQGSNYAIGMLCCFQNDFVAFTFDTQGKNFLNVEFDFSAIDLTTNNGASGSFGVAAPIMSLRLYDSPGGAFNINSPGTPISTATLTGIAPNADVFTFMWERVMAGLDASGSTDGNVTILFDLTQSGYAAFDNLLINASNVSVGSGCSEDFAVQCIGDLPTAPTLMGFDNCTANPPVTFMESSINGAINDQTLTRTWTVTDASSNSFSCVQNITIDDTTAPVADCQDITVNLLAGSSYTLTAAELNGTSSDNCGTTNLSIPPTTFGCSEVGTTVSVTLTVDDGNGNDATCVSMVTVTDTNTTCCDIAITSATPTDEVCPGANDGIITVTATCGVCVTNGTMIQYSISGPMNVGPQESNVFMNLPDGTYTVTVVDSGNTGCSAMQANVVVAAGADTEAPQINGLIASDAGWDEAAKALAFDGAAGDQFGYSVEISGDYAIVGARFDDDAGSNSGSAYVFVRSGTSWTEQAKLTASDAAAFDEFGYSVAISGDYAIVGAYRNDDAGSVSGSAYVFVRSGTSWTEQAKLTASDAEIFDFFGSSVAIDGDYLVVGSLGEDQAGGDAGSAYVFMRSGMTWTEQAKLIATDAAIGDNAGSSVAISGDYVVMGAPFSDDAGGSSGSAYVFVRSGTSWVQQAELMVSDAAAGDRLGGAVAISGDYALVGASGNDDAGDASGSAYVFVRSGMTWMEQQKLTATDAAQNDEFGASVAISNGIAIVGANGNDSSSGSAYVFRRSGTNWTEEEKLTASDAAAGDQFGFSAGISGSEVIVGAFTSDDTGSDSGSAYFFRTEQVLPSLTAQCSATLTTPTATDNCTGGTINGVADVSFPITTQGTTTVTWTFTDAAGNESMTTQEVTVEDTMDPTASCVNPINVALDGSQSASVTAALLDDGNFDNCGTVNLTITNGQTSYTCADLGQTYTLTLTVDDGNGNSNSCTVDVTVADPNSNCNGAPTAVCAPVIVDADANCMGEAAGAMFDGGSTDPDDDALTFTVSPEGPYALGETSVTLTVSDGQASNQCTTTVTVNDTQAPQINGLTTGAGWDEAAKALASDAAGGDQFGSSVAISGDYAIVGARLDDDAGETSGSAYVFARTGGSWAQQTKLTASDAAGGDLFGSSVAISGDYAIVGAPLDDDAGSFSGSAYVFVRSGTDWTQQTKLTASDAAAGDQFGWSVAISGDYAVVGARLDDAGSAYVFVRGSTTWTEQAKLTSSDAAAGDQFGFSVAIFGNNAIIGAIHDDDAGNVSGSAYVFERNGNNWIEQIKLTASDAATGDQFGNSVAISSDHLVIGSYLDDDAGDFSGAAYVFARSGITWTEQVKLTASDAATLDQFGQSVSISGERVVIGSLRGDGPSGSAYVFMFDGSEWTQRAILNASDAEVADDFGFSVAISNEEIIVSDILNDEAANNAGAVFFFKPEFSFLPVSVQCTATPTTPTATDNCTGGTINGVPDVTFPITTQGTTTVTWTFTDMAGNVSTATQEVTVEDTEAPQINGLIASDTGWAEAAKALASDGATGDQFGWSVALSGDRALVGASGHNGGSGAAYVFEFNGTSWTEQEKLTASDAAAGDSFGASVALSGDRAVVGASGNNGATGAVYVFEFNGTSWTQEAKLTASDAAAGDSFGYSVALSGDRAVIGAFGNDDTGGNSGSAYVFEFNGTSWTEQAKLLASDPAANDLFGFSVGLSGDRAVIGAFGNDDTGSNSGSAYVFEFNGTSWTEQVKLTASDGADSDEFGRAVAISGDYALVGARFNDNASGSAYVFAWDGLNWMEQQKLTASDASGGDEFGISVAISGDRALVGASRNDEAAGNAGAAYVFVRDGMSWTEQAKLTASDAAESDEFGISVALSGDRALVGAYFNDDAGSDSGSAYFFRPEQVLPPFTAQCSATPVTPTATDNCTGGTINGVSDVTFPITSQGTTTVTWTFTDGQGNVSTATQEVTVEDTEGPTFACPTDQTVDLNANCEFVVPDLITGLSANDNCTGSVSLSQSPSQGTLVVDNTDGATQMVTITATDDAGNTNATACTVTLTANNPGTVAIGDVAVDEFDSGTTTYDFIVTLTNPGCAFSVDYATADNGAVAGTDYVATSGTLNFSAGQTSQAISVTVNGDTDVEPDDQFFINLSNATNGVTITDGQGIITITNDDFFLCPTIGSLDGPAAVCRDETQTISATGLGLMEEAENAEQDFGIRFVYFAGATADPYTGGTDLGTVATTELEDGGSTANLEAAFPDAVGEIFVYAVLSPAPAEPTCRPSEVTSVNVYACGITNDDDANPTISDPCSCKDNATTLIDGQFDELVQVFDAPAGQSWTVVAIDGLFQSGSPAPPLAPLSIALGTELTEVPTTTAGVSDYELIGVHVDGVGYSIMVSNGSTTLALSNRCWYPNPSFDNLASGYCRTSGAVTLLGSAQLGDDSGAATPESETFMVINVDSGATVVNAAEGSAVLDITNLPAGRYRVIFTFNAADDDPDQNHPGCSQSIEREFEILEVNCGTFPWGGN